MLREVALLRRIPRRHWSEELSPDLFSLARRAHAYLLTRGHYPAIEFEFGEGRYITTVNDAGCVRVETVHGDRIL